MKKLEFKSKILDDEFQSEIYLALDKNFFYNNRIVNDKNNEGTRVTIKAEPHICINFSEDDVRPEIDHHFNVLFHGIGIDNDLVIQEEEYLLLDEKDKNSLEKFLNKAAKYLNNKYINHKFDNEYTFDSYHKEKHKEKRHFLKKLKENSWVSELKFTDKDEGHLCLTEVFKVSKDDKSFLYFSYGTSSDYEYIVKYDDDIKEEVESMFYEKDENVNIYLIPIAFALIIIAILTYYLFIS